LSGKGVGACVGVAQYGKDLINLKRILDVLYENSRFKPSLVAPGGFYEKEWYDKLLQVSGSGIINVLTHHLYNLGACLILSLIFLIDSSGIASVTIYF
jgi:heparanase 1